MADITQAVIPNSFLSWPVRGLVEMIADCPAFQERVGAYDGMEALKQRVFHPRLKAKDQFASIIRPAAVVWRLNGFGLIRQSQDTMYVKRGQSLGVTITDWDRYPDREDWSQIDFDNFVGQLIEQMAERQGKSRGEEVFPPIQEISERMPTQLTDPREASPDKRYWIAMLRVELADC